MRKKDSSATTTSEDIASRLDEFLASNSESSISEIVVNGEKKYAIKNPWGDKSFAIQIPENDNEFFDVLNGLILPQRLTAIYHRKSNKLEVIWTAYSLPETQQDVAKRAFLFVYDGKEHKCHFSRSSAELLKIAKYAVTSRMSQTSFRNLLSFRAYVSQQDDPSKTNGAISEPLSFWIEGIEWDLDEVIEIINNLNFYLTYYDNIGPTVLIHQEEDLVSTPRLRYISGKFPKVIRGKKLDNNLLSFWEASGAGDAARKFQYFYRIIEYASFFYLESSSRQAVRRALSSPDAIDDINVTTERLMVAFQMSKLDEYARFSALVQDTLDAKILWREVKENIPAFSKDIKFDGGFVLKAIISPTAKESTFCPKGVEIFTKAIRDIRNALSHGRDFKTAAVIIPSARNFKALQPWVHLISVAAGQVVLYKDIT